MTKGKKKRIRSLIIAATVLVVVCVLGFGAVILLHEEEEEQMEESYDIFADGANLTEVTFSNEYDDDLRFYKEGSDWYYGGDEEFPVSQSIFNSIGTQMESMKGYRKLEASEANIENFGCNDSQTRAILTTDAGKTYEYILGRFNESVNAYYLYDKRENAIYMVDSTFKFIFGYDLYSYAQCEEFPTLDGTAFRNMEVQYKDNFYEFYYTDEEDPTSMIQSTWYFGRPFTTKKPCDTTRLEDLVEAIGDLSYEKLAAYNADKEILKSFGIDGSNKVEIKYIEKTTDSEGNESEIPHTFTINVGNQDDSASYYYVQTTDKTLLSSQTSSNVYLVAKSSLEKIINLDPMDYAYLLVFSAGLSDIKDFTLTAGDETHYFEVDGSKVKDSTDWDSWEYYMDGHLLDDNTFRVWYRSLVSISAEEFITEKTENIKPTDPVIQIVFHQEGVHESLQELTVSFTEYNAGYYQTECNGVIDSLVAKAKVNSVIEAISGLIEE